MSLLDKVSEAKYSADSGAHPAEGCLHDGIYICVDGGEDFTYSVKRYEGVTMRMLTQSEDLPEPEVIIEAEWDACLQIYDLQVEIFQGLKDASELDKEIDAIKNGQVQQQQMNPTQQPGQGPQQPSQPGQQQQAPPAPTKGTQQDMLKMLANVDGALGLPVWEITQEIERMAGEENVEFGMQESEIYEVVEQWKRGDFEIDEEGVVTKGKVKVPDPDPEEEEEEEEEEEDEPAADDEEEV